MPDNCCSDSRRECYCRAPCQCCCPGCMCDDWGDDGYEPELYGDDDA